MKGIVLLSGGLDSTLVLLHMLKDGHEIVPMFVNYNQWASEAELEAFLWVGGWCELRFGCPPLLDAAYVRVVLSEEDRVGSVWGRGISLVGLAAMWAYTHGNDYRFIALGNHEGDVGPDCKPGLFDINLNNTLIEATKCGMELTLPIQHLTTEDIGKELAEFGIPWNLMYSCYWDPHCGYKSDNDEYLCPGCRRKFLAMKAGGSTEEDLLLPPNAPSAEEARTYQSEKAEKVGY